MRAVARVNLDAISSNVRVLRSRVEVPLMAVVKADAYGHGLVPVARAAIDGGAQWVGTALLSEGLELRRHGVTKPHVVSWLTPPGDDFAAAIEANVDLSASSIELLEEINSAASILGKRARVHLEVDTGMTRAGALGQWDQLVQRGAELMKSGNIEVVGIWSHFARADEPGHPANVAQKNSFDHALEVVSAAGIQPQVRHLANSAATLVDPSSHYDLVRTGIVMYGLSPDVTTLGSATKYDLTPAMTLVASLMLVKEVPSGVAVSYGGTAITKHATKVGVVPMGYADGVPRHGSNALKVNVGDYEAPVLGRICMDQFVIDLGPDSTAKAGDEVVLFGEGGPTVDAWASASGTVNYEIVTRLGPRVAREYFGVGA